MQGGEQEDQSQGYRSHTPRSHRPYHSFCAAFATLTGFFLCDVISPADVAEARAQQNGENEKELLKVCQGCRPSHRSFHRNSVRAAFWTAALLLGLNPQWESVAGPSRITEIWTMRGRGAAADRGVGIPCNPSHEHCAQGSTFELRSAVLGGKGLEHARPDRNESQALRTYHHRYVSLRTDGEESLSGERHEG